VSSITRPVKGLKNFKRINLARGETKIVKFEIAGEKLHFYNIDMKRDVEPGEFQIMVGTNSEDYLSDVFEIIQTNYSVR
jgi:beta-glucosidase